MTVEEFKAYAGTGNPSNTEEILALMDRMSSDARKITFRLNTAYHTPEEIRNLLSELFGYRVPESFRVSRHSIPILARISG